MRCYDRLGGGRGKSVRKLVYKMYKNIHDPGFDSLSCTIDSKLFEIFT